MFWDEVASPVEDDSEGYSTEDVHDYDDLTLTPSQTSFYFDTTRFCAFIAGFGSGKTLIGCLKLYNTALTYPDIPQGYFAPTFPLIRDIFYPTIEELARRDHREILINKSSKTVSIEGAAPIICRSMTNPETIVGFEIGDALIDEFDILKMDIANLAWNKIIARMRKKYPDGKPNRIDVVTTPEGYKATYHLFKKEERPGYSIHHGSTYENAHNLPAGYIESLEETYPPELIEAYLKGQFVNLYSGRVYKCYDRIENNSDEEVKPREDIHVGMDFNVMHCAAVIHVMRGDEPHAVDEIYDAFDTDTMIDILKERYPNNEIHCYPDSTGVKRHSSNTAQSDIAKLKQAGFTIHAKTNNNPHVKDRVASMNAMFLNGKGQRRYHVNVRKCPNYCAALEQQVYDQNGIPDKSTGIDHVLDAPGYFIAWRWPVKSSKASKVVQVGLT